VLFSPLSAPTQDVTFTATGSGAPTAELVATAVNPSATPGLGQAGQDATATAQQDDFWQGYAGAADGGLTQLAAGIAKVIAGLNQLAPGAHQLADGLKAAGAGATKLDAGTASAYDGAKKIAAGTKTAHSGAGALSSGVGQIAAGNTDLAGGLAKINGGLALLDGKTPASAGVKAAADAIAAIEAGVKQVLVGLQGVGGSVGAPTDADPTTNPPTPSVLKALGLIKGGVDLVRTPLWNDLLALKGLTTPGSPAFNPAFAALLAPKLADGITDNPSFDAPLAAWVAQLGTDLGTAALPAGVDPAHPAGGALAQASAGLDSLLTGVGRITVGLNAHTPGTFGVGDHGGVDYGLLALLDPASGLPAVVGGIDALYAGSAAALDGAGKLAAGATAAAAGSKALDSGLGKLATGTAALAGGLGQLAAGQHQVATGLPAAVSGSAKIAGGVDAVKSGVGQIGGGLGQVQSGAVGPLNTQLLQGSQNAKKQVAILDAAAGMAAQAPGGAGTSYVLTQSPTGFRLAAATTPVVKASSSHTARDVGVGLGGLAALVAAVIAGIAVGRRGARVTV
jgi:putative membrane protein